jgi:hypothetical protein
MKLAGSGRCHPDGMVARGKGNEAESLVRVAGLEPALLAKTDFESVASTIPPHPHNTAPLVVPFPPGN